MIASMADALSSAGLLLAALALVFSAWTPSIECALNKNFSPGAAEKAREKKSIKSIRGRRALPLAVASWLITILFIPRDIAIFVTTAGCVTTRGKGCGYDDVAVIFLLTQMVFAFLAWHVSSQARELNKKAA